MRRFFVALILAVAVSACGGDKLTHVPAPGTHTEVFPQNAASKIDLLWVVDNSGSMADKQAKLAASFQRFIDAFAAGAIDYRIAVTTTDVFADVPGSAGNFYGTPTVIKPTDDDPLQEFQINVKVGTNGSGNEEGLQGAKLALDKVNAANAGTYAAYNLCSTSCTTSTDRNCVATCQAQHEPDFLRPDAYLYVVFVSDDEDHSDDEPIHYARYLQTVKGLGNEAMVAASAIVGDPSGPPCDARAGVKYADVAQYTGGIFGSICDSTFDQNLTNIAQNAVGLQRHFLLGANPQLTPTNTLALQINYRCDTPQGELTGCQSVTSNCSGAAGSTLGLACIPPQSTQVPVDADHPEGFTHGWTYACADNSITFHKDATGDSVPGLRSQLAVTFLVSSTVQCSP
ncbi:MAG: VWA domain-containing protein [Deltaproteobacteria bacterium]|nr:VWA domain-containing protein [Deltaproteobacteria bacterium]